MRRITFVTVAFILALVTTALATAQFQQTADLRYTPAKKNVSSGYQVSLTTRDPGEPNGKPQKTMTKVTVTFQPGTKFRTQGVYAACKATASQLRVGGAAACPSSSRNGTGTFAMYASSPAKMTGRITTFNKKNGVLLLLASQPGQSLALDGKLSGTKLTINVPPVVQLNAKTVITDLSFRIAKRRAGSGRKARFYMTTSPNCSGSWATNVAISYDDGSSFNKTVTQSCR